MLSDIDIVKAIKAGEIVIDPRPSSKQIQPASVDVHLGRKFGRLKKTRSTQLLTDPSDVEYFERDNIALHPGKFLLGQLAERLTINGAISCRIEGKSSIGRKGVAIHVTAGFVDPGWDGYLTIEIFNASNITYILKEGDPIAQLAFYELKTPAKRPYGHPDLNSHYQGSEEVRGSLHDSSH